MTSPPSQTMRRQVFIYIPKIYEPLSDSESEQELAEHYENAIFSQSEEEDELESFWEVFETTLRWCCAVKCWKRKWTHGGTLTIAFVFPSISVCYKGLISNKKYFRREFQLSIMKKTVLWSGHGSKSHLPYLPVYKSIPCISRPPIFEPKNKFFLFLCKHFLKNFSFILECPFRYAMVSWKKPQQAWT